LNKNLSNGKSGFKVITMKKNYFEIYDKIVSDVLKNSAPPPFKKENVKKKLIAAFKEEFLKRETISFQIFIDKEFNNDSEIEELCRLIMSDYPKLRLSAKAGTIEWLNKLLETGRFYDMLSEKHRKINFDNYITTLIRETTSYRPNVFEYLGDYKRMKIIRLNRLILEAIYPNNTPEFVNFFYSAKVSYYMGPYAKEAFRDVFVEDIEKRYFLDYRVADMALYFEGVFDLMQIDYNKIMELQGHGYNEYPSAFSRHIFHRAVLDIPLLIVGETGTGKELCARAIHLISARRKEQFEEINCAAIPDTLLESEVFGHEKGAASNLNFQKKGPFELADKGTVFLDEIGKMSLNLQAKILKAVEEKKIKRLGSQTSEDINVRFIAAVQPKDIEENHILPDLLYRLGYPDVIKMPTLNERIDELGKRLLDISLKRTIKKIGSINPELKIDSALIDALKNHTYKGNFRELEGIYRMAIINAKAEATNEKHWPMKYDDFCAGKYVKEISSKNIHGLIQAKDRQDQKTEDSVDSIEKVPLRSIVEYAEKKASEIIEKRVKKIVQEGKNIKDVLMSEGVSEREYQNILGKITRNMGKGIKELKKQHARQK